jgi:hypothetical protein
MYESQRNSLVSSRGSWVESESEDDMITPCPIKESTSVNCQTISLPIIPQSEVKEAMAPASRRQRRQNSISSERSASKVDDVEGLWRCMLELQQRYGCYRSARMQAAVSMYESESGMDLMPSRACLDLLNDSIDDLPEEGWEMLDKYLPGDHDASHGRNGSRKHGWRFWKH